jgi:hypothetical protein
VKPERFDVDLIVRESDIVVPALAKASRLLALAQQRGWLDVAEEGVEFASVALNRLGADTRLAKHVADAREWVVELREDLDDTGVCWDRSLDARCGLLRTGLDEIRALMESPLRAKPHRNAAIEGDKVTLTFGIADLATHKKDLAAAITRAIAARTAELRKRNVRNPVAQAEKEIAARLQKSGPALNRWLRRNR